MTPEKLLKRICNDQLPERLIIRVDAGSVKGLSFGHLSRCLVLAKAIKKASSDAKINFIMRDYPEGVKYAVENGMDVLTIPPDIPQAKHDAIWKQKTKELNPDWTFIDLPYLNSFSSICKFLKEQGSKTLFIDDVRFINPQVDTLLNSSILAKKTIIHRHPGTQYLLGPDYLIFDYKNLLSKKSDEKFRIAMSFGGSDPSGLTLKAVTAIKPLLANPKIVLTVILGPGFRQKNRMTSDILKQQPWVNLSYAPNDIYSYFLNSDLVICAGGRTLYELNQLKIAAFPIASITHERDVIKAFIEKQIVETGMLVWDTDRFQFTMKKLLKKHRLLC